MKKLFISGLIIFVVCFVLASVMWFGFERQNNKLNTAHKSFPNDKINGLHISSQNSFVEVKRGKQFSVSYKGQKKLNVQNHNGTLYIKEQRNSEDHYGLNFNPFRKIKEHLVVTVPDKKLKQFDLKSKRNRVEVNQLDVEKAKINMAYEGIVKVGLNRSNVDKLFYRGKNSPVTLTKDKIANANIKSSNAHINAEESLIEKSVLLVTRDKDIHLDKMDINSNFKASSENGDIIMSYNRKPENVLLKLNPSDGKSKVFNSSFNDDKVGKGDNVLEMYTEKGNIQIN
ncbi:MULTISPECIES: DUF4097 family beta strand repeat-containing protein [Staphylococcus]|uniref:DUF4097 family beta strand repeat-containing protein n=1 Tax=Staphylococcus hsinchuensis TaxID=3051183 RepID=A0ABZ3ED62_9STAP|nr:DUF4097 family beta strand repeat-containing protein [Staphylococcus sp. Marseille-Q6910]